MPHLATQSAPGRSTRLHKRPTAGQNQPIRSLARLAALCVGSLLLTGCGGSVSGPLAEVTGQVTRGGEPLEGVNVMFIPQDGQGAPSGAVTDNNGEFRLTHSDGSPGALLGSHRVVISVSGEEPPPPEAGSRPARQAPAPEYYKQAEVSAEEDNHFLFEVPQGTSRYRTS